MVLFIIFHIHIKIIFNITTKKKRTVLNFLKSYVFLYPLYCFCQLFFIFFFNLSNSFTISEFVLPFDFDVKPFIDGNYLSKDSKEFKVSTLSQLFFSLDLLLVLFVF